MARCETMIVVLVFLIVVDLSLAKNVDTAESLESIVAELKQLNQRVYDLELKDNQQTQKISQLEHDLESSNKLNSDLRKQHSENRELIRDLTNSMVELKRQMTLRNDYGKELNVNSIKPPTDILFADHRGMNGSANDPKSDSKEEGQEGSRSLSEGISQVAFSATITPHDYGPLGLNQIVVFDRVLTNVGNGYRAHSGIFTAPVAGVYVVSVTISGWLVIDHCYFHVMVNGSYRCSIWAARGDQSSQLLVLNLGARDDVYVSNAHVSETIFGQSYSSFSGFLLFPSDESNAIVEGSRSLTEGTPQVAFSATITPHDYGPLGDAQIVIFDNVLTNVGNGYHDHSGIFTAPVAGVYVVSVTISGWKVSTDHHYLQVMVNGSHRCWIWATGGDQSSQLLVLNLGAMDEVYVSNERVSDTILGATFSSFSGFLLFPSDESNAIVGK